MLLTFLDLIITNINNKMSNPSSPVKSNSADKIATPTKSSPAIKSASSTPSKPTSSSSTPKKDNEGASIQRQFSEQSENAMKSLDRLDEQFAMFTRRIERIDKSIDVQNPESLINAKNELAQIIAGLENLQFNEVIFNDHFTHSKKDLILPF